jgi:hypothetical protein
MCSTDEGFFSTKKIIKATLADYSKVECLIPNSGRRMNIEKSTYDIFFNGYLSQLKREGDTSHLHK